MADIVIQFVLYFLAGASLKAGDDLLDELERPTLSWMPLGIAGVAFGIISTLSEWDMSLIVSILIAVVVAGKVNRPQFIIGFVLMAGVVLICGIPPISSMSTVLIIVGCLVIAGALDEYGDAWTEKRMTQNPVTWFFRFRFTMKCAVLLLVIPFPQFIFTAIGLWIFDIGYNIVERIMKAVSHADKQDYNTHPQIEE